MRCNICDAGLSEVHYNSDHESFEPCVTCLEAVKDTLEGFLDKPSADEDELGGPDPLFESLSFHSGHSFYSPHGGEYEE